MHRKPGGLVADDEGPVFVDDGQLAGFRGEGVRGPRQFQAQPLPRSGPEVGRGDRGAVHERAPLPDGFLHGAAREPGLRRAQDAVKALAVLLRGNGMLQAVHGRGPAGVVRVRMRSTKVTGR